MPELLLELFSEEIPARMQARGADDLARLLGEALAALAPADARTFFGPRRIAYVARVAEGVAESRASERGPRVTAPEQALAGFLRKHAAAREALRQEGEFWVLDRVLAGLSASALIAREVPGVLRKFPWPKSMRWGGTSAFTWVRPLRRICCILDGAVVPFDLRQGEDDGHGLASGDLSEGHRFLAPGAFAVSSAAQWRQELRDRFVIADAAERRAAIEMGVTAVATEQGLSVVPDPGLLDEVTGLVEFPVPLLGQIGAEFMDLPPEVMQVSMRVNQRYFALRDATGAPAPWFAFVGNVPGEPDPRAIIAGNERVLRARFSDARHFWDLDRQRTLESRVPDLDAVTFHAKLGSQGDRVRRLVRIVRLLATVFNADIDDCIVAARVSKADLTTGMVSEFPELQGVIGGYYACHDGLSGPVRQAVRDQYAPRGPSDDVPNAPVSVVLGLADRLDQLVQFFEIGEKPTGSGDPLALRRAALGVLRLLRVSGRDPHIGDILIAAGATGPIVQELIEFLLERWRVQERAAGFRHDILAAVTSNGEDRIGLLDQSKSLLTDELGSAVGVSTLAAYRRAANILRIETSKAPLSAGEIDHGLLHDERELELFRRVAQTPVHQIRELMVVGGQQDAIRIVSGLRRPLDDFFEHVTVNAPEKDVRANRLRLLARIVETMNAVADFSKIEG